MAKRYIGVDLGKDRESDVTASATTTGLDVEVVVDQATSGINKDKVLIAFEVLKNYTIKDTALLG
jgi:hypothetical protein